MHAKGVRHIRDLILLIGNLMDLRHRALVLDVLIGGSGESGLSEASLEDLHDAVRSCMAARLLASTSRVHGAEAHML